MGRKSEDSLIPPAENSLSPAVLGELNPQLSPHLFHFLIYFVVISFTHPCWGSPCSEAIGFIFHFLLIVVFFHKVPHSLFNLRHSIHIYWTSECMIFPHLTLRCWSLKVDFNFLCHFRSNISKPSSNVFSKNPLSWFTATFSELTTRPGLSGSARFLVLSWPKYYLWHIPAQKSSVSHCELPGCAAYIWWCGPLRKGLEELLPAVSQPPGSLSDIVNQVSVPQLGSWEHWVSMWDVALSRPLSSKWPTFVSV